MPHCETASVVEAMKTRLAGITNWAERAEAADYNVRNFAKACGVSPRALRRYFQRAFKQAPQKWLNELRLMVGQQKLLTGEQVKAAAADGGFKHASSFCRTFKEKFHLTPLQFAALYRKELQVAAKANKWPRRLIHCPWERSCPLIKLAVK